MPPAAGKSRKRGAAYDSDDGFVAADSADENAPQSKKSKTTAVAKREKDSNEEEQFWEVRWLTPTPELQSSR